jgi:hypothetical protein
MNDEHECEDFDDGKREGEVALDKWRNLGNQMKVDLLKASARVEVPVAGGDCLSKGRFIAGCHFGVEEGKREMTVATKKRPYPATRMPCSNDERANLLQFYHRYEESHRAPQKKIVLSEAIQKLNTMSPGQWGRRRIQKYFDNIRIRERVNRTEVQGEEVEEVEEGGKDDEIVKAEDDIGMEMPSFTLNLHFLLDLDFGVEAPTVQVGPGWDAHDWRIIPPLNGRKCEK